MSATKYERGGTSMKITAMLSVALPLAAIALVGPTQSQQLQTGVAYSPGKSFDQLSWSAFVAAVKPAPQPAPAGTATFETWATDADTFQTDPPLCPDPNVTAVAVAARNNNRFQTSFLERAHRPTGLQQAPAAACRPHATLRAMRLRAISQLRPGQLRRPTASPRKCGETSPPANSSATT